MASRLRLRFAHSCTPASQQYHIRRGVVFGLRSELTVNSARPGSQTHTDRLFVTKRNSSTSSATTNTNTNLLDMKPLSVDALNPAIRKVEYAVRGELAIKAEAYRVQLQQPNHGLPFDRVISSNIGNPQQKGLDQKPLTFTRQVSHLVIIRWNLHLRVEFM